MVGALWFALGFLLAWVWLRIVQQFEEASSTSGVSAGHHGALYSPPRAHQIHREDNNDFLSFISAQLSIYSNDVMWLKVLSRIVKAEVKQEVVLVVYLVGRLLAAFFVLMVTSWLLRYLSRVVALQRPGLVRWVAKSLRRWLVWRPTLCLLTIISIALSASFIVSFGVAPAVARAGKTTAQSNVSVAGCVRTCFPSPRLLSLSSSSESRGKLVRAIQKKKGRIHVTTSLPKDGSSAVSCSGRRTAACVLCCASALVPLSPLATLQLLLDSFRLPLIALTIQSVLIALALPASVLRVVVRPEARRATTTAAPDSPLRRLLTQDDGLAHRLAAILYVALIVLPTVRISLMWWNLRARALTADQTMHEQALSYAHMICSLLWLRGCASALGHLCRLCMLPDHDSPLLKLSAQASTDRLELHLLIDSPTYIFWWAVSAEMATYSPTSAAWPRLLLCFSLLGVSQVFKWIPHSCGLGHDHRWRLALKAVELLRCLEPTATALGFIGARLAIPVGMMVLAPVALLSAIELSEELGEDDTEADDHDDSSMSLVALSSRCGASLHEELHVLARLIVRACETALSLSAERPTTRRLRREGALLAHHGSRAPTTRIGELVHQLRTWAEQESPTALPKELKPAVVLALHYCEDLLSNPQDDFAEAYDTPSRRISRLSIGLNVTCCAQLSAAASEIWPVAGHAVSGLLSMLLNPLQRHELRRGLLRWREQNEAERAPWALPQFAFLREWLLVPQLGLRGSLVAHDDIKLERGVPCTARVLHAKTCAPLHSVGIKVNAMLSLGPNAVVRLHLSLSLPVLVRVPECFSGNSPSAGLFNAKVVATSADGRSCDVRYQDKVELLLGHQIHSAEFNLWTQVDLPFPPWKSALFMWSRGLAIEWLLPASHRAEDVLNCRWVEPTAAQARSGRIGSLRVELALTNLGITARASDLALSFLNREHYTMVKLEGRGGLVSAVIWLHIEGGRCVSSSKADDAVIPDGGIYLSVESLRLQLQELRLDQAAGRLGIVKIAGVLAKVTATLAPGWLRSKVWQPLLNIISQALLKDNQFKPVLKWSELLDIADWQLYLQRAANRQRVRHEAQGRAFLRRLAWKYATSANLNELRCQCEDAFTHTSAHGYLISLGRVKSPAATGSLLRQVGSVRNYVVVKGNTLIEYSSMRHAVQRESKRECEKQKGRASRKRSTAMDGRHFHIQAIIKPSEVEPIFTVAYRSWFGRQEHRSYYASSCSERDRWYSLLCKAIGTTS